jgi:hypothetical protein
MWNMPADKEEDSVLHGTNGDVWTSRAADIKQRTELWTRWVEFNPDKAAQWAERHGISTQDLPRRCA